MTDYKHRGVVLHVAWQGLKMLPTALQLAHLYAHCAMCVGTAGAGTAAMSLLHLYNDSVTRRTLVHRVVGQ